VSALTPAEAAAAADLGTASARKAGRNPSWPYVPVLIVHGGTVTSQIKGRAFATRAEAVAYAEAHIAAERAALACKLAEPRYRALRAQHGVTGC
jgi:hypothetical protein